MKRGTDAKNGPLRLALTVDEAADAVGGMSKRFFETEVLPQLRVIRLGSGTGERRKTYIPIAELEKWIERNAALWFDGALG